MKPNPLRKAVSWGREYCVKYLEISPLVERESNGVDLSWANNCPARLRRREKEKSLRVPRRVVLQVEIVRTIIYFMIYKNVFN